MIGGNILPIKSLRAIMGLVPGVYPRPKHARSLVASQFAVGSVPSARPVGGTVLCMSAGSTHGHSLAPQQRPARLRVGVVGAGRVGAVLGAALGRAGHQVIAVSAVSAASRARAAALLPDAAILPIPEVVHAAELLLLTVPDDELALLISGLRETGSWRPGQIAVHCSGRFGIDVFAPAQAQQVLGLALHPALTFTGTAVDLDRLPSCSFGVTAPPPFRAVAEALVVEMGAEPHWVAEGDRPLYHAALTHGANHLVTLVAQAAQTLAATGIANPNRVLAPLLSAALDGALRGGDAALTGPVSRADIGTLAHHLAALTGPQEIPADIRASYVAMARATAARALADGRLAARFGPEIMRTLAEPGSDPGSR